MAIDVVLAGLLPPQGLAALKAMQKVVDRDQRAGQSDEHAMTGVEENQDEKTAKPIYIGRTEKLLRDRLTDAINARKNGRPNDAYDALGKAIHALTDATSPAHRGFQVWRDNESLSEWYRHVTQENIYPSGETRTRLEGALRWAYAIYIEKAAIPTRFFDADGNLQIPPAYLTGK
jgi:hypothetical protein